MSQMPPESGSAPAHRSADESGDAIPAADPWAEDSWIEDPDWASRRAPSDEELAGYWPDEDSGPPDGELEWLGMLRADQLAELAGELQAARPFAERDSIGAGFSHCQAAAGIAAGERGWEPDYVAGLQAGPAAGFAAGGVLDTAAAGPVLASLAQEVLDGGLSALSDDQLVGLMAAARRLASWQTAIELTAVSELDARRRREETARRQADQRAGRVGESAGERSVTSERVAAELACALTLTGRAADGLLCLARDLSRLPQVLAALMAGRIDLAKARVFASELSAVDDLTASRLASAYLDRARGWTASELRRALRAAVLSVDPDAGRRRAEKARAAARVEAWQENSGNAGMSGRELPAAEAMAADARLSQLARALKASGAAGTLDQLRAAVYLALLLGKDPGDLAPGLMSKAGEGSAGSGGLGGTIHLTLPAMTWLGLADRPGELAGLGPVDACTARELARLVAGSGAAAWHVTLTDDQGQAVAHACPRGQPPDVASPGAGPARSGPPRTGQPGTGPPADPRVRWLAGLAFEWLERDDCSHQGQTRAYQPGKALRHLLEIRNPTCTAPGCRWPARRCDNEHTVPFDEGGKTCQCNCGPVCRRHHRVKQSPGWHLEQSRPGHLTWTTPAGRSYCTGPGTYPG